MLNEAIFETLDFLKRILSKLISYLFGFIIAIFATYFDLFHITVRWEKPFVPFLIYTILLIFLISICFFLYRMEYKILLKIMPSINSIEPRKPIRIEPFSRWNFKNASLKVTNCTSKTILCTGILKLLVHEYSPEERIDITDKINPMNERFSWSNKQNEDYINIGPDNYAILNIAYHTGNQIGFTFTDNTTTWKLINKFMIWVEVQSRDGEIRENFYGCLEKAGVIGLKSNFFRIKIWECEDVKEWIEHN